LLSFTSFDAVDTSDKLSTLSVAFIDAGLSNCVHLDAVSQHGDMVGGCSDVNKHSEVNEVINSDVLDTHVSRVESGDDSEADFAKITQTVCFSELQYIN